jgi:hypothetical protein
MDPQPGQ